MLNGIEGAAIFTKAETKQIEATLRSVAGREFTTAEDFTIAVEEHVNVNGIWFFFNIKRLHDETNALHIIFLRQVCTRLDNLYPTFKDQLEDYDIRITILRTAASTGLDALLDAGSVNPAQIKQYTERELTIVTDLSDLPEGIAQYVVQWEIAYTSSTLLYRLSNFDFYCAFRLFVLICSRSITFSVYG